MRARLAFNHSLKRDAQTDAATKLQTAMNSNRKLISATDTCHLSRCTYDLRILATGPHPPTKTPHPVSPLSCIVCSHSPFLPFHHHFLAVLSKTPTRLKRMGSIVRQESFGEDDDLYDGDVVLEAPTLTSKEMTRAREEALYVLKTKSPEEAFKIFTEGLKYKVDGPPGQGQAQAQTARPPATTPANGKGQAQTTAGVFPRAN
uniref:Uncharacterized protein n=1 Tax=Avena sativa TaxID=4498 RepID=A0ACD5UR54_AVESA